MGRSEMERKVRSQWKLGYSVSHLGSRCRGRRTEAKGVCRGNGKDQNRGCRGSRVLGERPVVLLQHRGPWGGQQNSTCHTGSTMMTDESFREPVPVG